MVDRARAKWAEK